MEHSLVGNWGMRLIGASRLIQELQLVGSVEGSMRDASMGPVGSMQRHKQQEVIGMSCCKNDYGWVEEVELVVGKSCLSSLTLVRFEAREKFDLEQEHFRWSNSGIRP
jgi:hypothetical protein